MKKTLLTILLAMTLGKGYAQQIAVGTDVATDVLMIPSIGAEMTVGNRTTLALNVTGTHNPWGHKIKMLGVQPEYRYYVSGRTMHKLFVGIGAVAAFYDATIKRKVYDGIAYGGGLTFGYVINASTSTSTRDSPPCDTTERNTTQATTITATIS